jgi:hypothetical protein
MITPDKQYAVSIVMVNNGRATAIGPLHYGMISFAKGSLADDTAIRQLLAFSRIVISTSAASSNEIAPQTSDQFFRVFSNSQVSEQQASDLDKGDQVAYIINLIRYRDNHLAAGEFIFTETCKYYFKGELHNCESGHNRSYISY